MGSGKSIDVEKTSRTFLTGVLLPAWMLAGFGDYLCHRASKIERTSGTHESLTHLVMLASAGMGLTAALFCELNETVLAIMTASAVAHEAIVLWDVRYAAALRPPSCTEQHLHSVLEVVPFTGLAFTMCLHPDDLAVMLGRGGDGAGVRIAGRPASRRIRALLSRGPHDPPARSSDRRRAKPGALEGRTCYAESGAALGVRRSRSAYDRRRPQTGTSSG